MKIQVREYRDSDRNEWMRVHAIILSISHAWNYSIQERPDYDGYESTRIVAEAIGEPGAQSHIVGLLDTQFDRTPGELCMLKDSLGGYVLEFGRLPEYAGHGIGKLLMDAAAQDALKKGVHRLEYWTQDRKAQRYYRRLEMKEIGRHYRFRMRATEGVKALLRADYIGVEYIYGACMPEEWPNIKAKYDIIESHPLEPHLCVGFEARF